MKRLIFPFASLCVLACSPPVEECNPATGENCDAGGLIPDFCNSAEEADNDVANCHLTVTTGGAAPVRKEGVYISTTEDGGVDRDWYVAQLPALTARSLIHINGGYTAPQTAVTFSLNVLHGQVSVANGSDARAGGAAPKPVDLIFPFSESNAKLYIMAADAPGPQLRVDNRNPYSLYIEVQENPDVNEPNDETPTAIDLPAVSGGFEGAQTGYLATTDDVDLFEFQVTGSDRQLIHLAITGVGDHPTNPPPPYRLSYTLYAPDGSSLDEGRMENSFLPINLKTVRLAPEAGAYRVAVRGYKPSNDQTPVKGDLRVQYEVRVRVLPDLDTQEPNDTADTARTVSINANSNASVTGRLSYLGDADWYRVDLAPPRASPGTLRYRLTVNETGGRFEPLTNTPVRQLDLVKRVTTGATPQDRVTACRNDRTECPRAADGDTVSLNSYCDVNDPPQCLHAHREEERPRLSDLRNLTGAIPIAANGGGEYLFAVRDQGQGERKYADDYEYTLTLEWQDDADENGRLGGPEVHNIAASPVVIEGNLSFGYGKYLDDGYFDRNSAVRGRADYDAIDTDQDMFQFNVTPAPDGGVDLAWNLTWELFHRDGGSSAPGELGVELIFCQSIDAGTCVGRTSRVLAWNDSNLTPWYLTQSAGNARQLFTRSSGGNLTTVGVAPVACTCLSAPRQNSGAYFLNLSALERTSNEPLRYRVTQTLSPYPQSDGDGGMCPVVDGGCGFAR